MRILFVIVLFISCFIANTAFADDVSELKEQIKTLTNAVKELKDTVEVQQKEINSLKETQNAKPPVSVVQPAAQPAAANTILPGKFTPEIGAVADIATRFEKSKFDTENANRVQVRELELVLGSNVDPYSRLDATVAFTEESKVDLEEAYLTRFGLPFDITARIGRFKPKIGKMLPVHRDSIDTVDEPLVIQHYFGEEGMNKSGVDFTKIIDLPLPSVHQVTFGVIEGGNGEGGTAFGSAVRRPTPYGHLKNYWDITDVTNFELGISDALGSNDKDKSFESNVLGLDATLRHTLNPNQEVKLQGETYYLHRKESLDGLDGTTDPRGNFWGSYGLLDFRLSSLWGTGFRFDYVEPVDRLLSDPNKAEIGYSEYLTFYQSEFARWRIQYSHIDRTTGENDNRVFLQGTFAIGEHKHKLQ